MEYVDFVCKGGHVCSTATGQCRSFAHFVFTTGADSLTDSLVGGASYRLTTNGTNSSLQAGGPTMFERHLVTGVCDGDMGSGNCTEGELLQMWNWGYDAVHADNSSLPERLCVSPWLRDVSGGKGVVDGALAEKCVDMPVAYYDPVNATTSSMTTAYNNFSSAAHVYCDNATALCRTNVHIVFTVGTNDVLSPVVGGAEFAFDGGDWQSTQSTVVYEQHIDALANSTFPAVQAWQADYDALSPIGQGAAKRVCFRVWLQDVVTTATTWLQYGDGNAGAYDEHCLPLCTTLVPFHNPKGYCGV